MIGRTISHYRIVEKLGEGGMGVVYVAEDTVLGRRVAIKTLTARGGDNQHFRARFLREARAVSALSHPNIAAIYDYGQTEDGDPYIVMELIKGETLGDLMLKEKLTIPRSIEIIKQVAEGLGEAHSQGIIHRDIKPSNVAINERGNVKVLDFGLAKQIQLEPANPSDPEQRTLMNTQTREGVIVGTPLYFSPEQALGVKIDPRSDLFAVGSLLYECITGKPAFSGNNDIDTCAKVVRDDPSPPSVVNPGVSTELDRIVLKALAKKPELRYQTAEELALDLAAANSATSMSRNLSIRKTMLSFAGYARISKDGAVHKWALFAVLSLAIAAMTLIGLRWSGSSKGPLASTLRFARLSITGNIKEATISPDGKYVGAIIDENGKQSLWIKQSETPNDLRIIEPTESRYRGVIFSPKGDYVYFLKETGDTATLCRISILGGTTQQLIQHVDSQITFSPNGDRLAFVRADDQGKASSLMLASAIGSDLVTLLTLTSPQSLNLNGFYGSGPAWSPDGTIIVVPGHNISPNSNMDVLAVRVIDGAVTSINRQPWNLIEKLSWRADGTGLLMNAIDRPSTPLQLWLLHYPKGDAERITNDPNSYINVSSTRGSDTVLVTKLERLSSVWMLNSSGRVYASPVTATKDIAGSGISWTPDLRMIYSSVESGGQNLWIVHQDGTKPLQLTFDEDKKVEPSVSPDGRLVAYVAYHNGQPHAWTLDLGNSSARQLTNGEYEDLPRFSPDSKWVVYHSIRNETYRLEKLSVEGGQPIELSDRPATQPDISPDGKLIACFLREEASSSTWRLALIPFNGGPPVREFDIPATVSPEWPGIRWTSDGSSLIYVVTSGGVSNLWTQSVKGGVPKPLTDFAEGQIFSFDQSKATGDFICIRGVSKRELFVLQGLQ
jgi:serine/threonine protein kinase